MINTARILGICLMVLCAAAPLARASQKVPAAALSATQWAPVELSFTSSRALSWRSFPVQVTFRLGRTELTLDAYWDGERNWKVRFAAPLPGAWRYTTASTDPGLDNHTGTIRVRAPSSQQVRMNQNFRGQIKVGAGGHHFAYADGTPVLILADCQVLGRLPAEAFRKSVERRKEQGFNGFNVRLAKAGEKNEGGEPYLGKQVDRLNPAHFQWVDVRLKHLWEAGFVTFFMPDFLGQGVYSMADARDVSRYLLARYAGFNVAYIITGEYDNFRRNVDFWDRYEPWNELGAYVKTINDRASKVPLGVHPLNASSGKQSHAQSWLDYNQIQSKLWREFDTVPLAVLTDYRREPAKPTFYAEGIYENQPWAGDVGTDWHVRHQTWVPLTCGAAVVDYGEHHIKGGDIAAADWEKYLDAPGARQATYALRFMQALEWWKFAPRREWVLVGGAVPPLSDPKANTALPYCLADPGRAYVAYLMRGLGAAELTLTHLAGKAYRAKWFDPRRDLSIEINGGAPINTARKEEWPIPARPAPADEDWVLLLTAIEDEKSKTSKKISTR